jgi:hypothetical protein
VSDFGHRILFNRIFSNWIFGSGKRLIATPTVTRTMSSSQRTILITSHQMIRFPRITKPRTLTTQMTHNSRITNLLRTALVIPTISIQSLLDKRPTSLSQLINTMLVNSTTITPLG